MGLLAPERLPTAVEPLSGSWLSSWLQEDPEEDEPGWDCHTMGNRSCVPLDWSSD